MSVLHPQLRCKALEGTFMQAPTNLSMKSCPSFQCSMLVEPILLNVVDQIRRLLVSILEIVPLHLLFLSILRFVNSMQKRPHFITSCSLCIASKPYVILSRNYGMHGCFELFQLAQIKLLTELVLLMCCSQSCATWKSQ